MGRLRSLCPPIVSRHSGGRPQQTFPNGSSREGLQVNLYMGRTNNDLCPITAMMAYLANRGDGDGPLFRFQNGQPLTRERFVAKVREALSTSGIDHNKYAGHSFRIGAATTAAQCGIPDSTIKLLGRWESSAYLLYVRTPRETLAALSVPLSVFQS